MPTATDHDLNIKETYGMKRNRNAALWFVLLLLVNVIFFFLTVKGNSVSFDEDLFAIRDTASVTSIEIIEDSKKLVLTRNPEGWILNGEYPADEGLRRLLMSILMRVQVKKPVEVEKADVKTVIVHGARPMNFEVWGNLTKTRTFFSMSSGEAVYEVAIPGYNEYLGGIFELNEDQWRDRLLIDGSWRTIQKLSLDYLGSDEKDFLILFDENFFKVESVPEIDSAAVIGYLNQFQVFQINEWISDGRFPRYDSLSRMPPLATLTIETINQQDPAVLDIYPALEEESFHLATDHDGNMMVVDKKRIDAILAERTGFEAVD